MACSVGQMVGQIVIWWDSDMHHVEPHHFILYAQPANTSEKHIWTFNTPHKKNTSVYQRCITTLGYAMLRRLMSFVHSSHLYKPANRYTANYLRIKNTENRNRWPRISNVRVLLVLRTLWAVLSIRKMFNWIVQRLKGQKCLVKPIDLPYIPSTLFAVDVTWHKCIQLTRQVVFH